MVSLKSLKRFVIINSLVFSVAYIHYTVLVWVQYNLLVLWLTVLFENIIIHTCYSQLFASKKFITEGTRTQQFNLANFVGGTLIHPVTILLVHTVTTGPPTSYFYDVITFIPMSFAFEILFDFFHYWTHRTAHTVPWIYRNLHKTHHEHQFIDINSTYHIGSLDVFLTVSVPFFLSASMIPVSDYSIMVLYWYKTIVEHAGHVGKEGGSSFPQFIWLPKVFGIELYSNDHNYHHVNGKYNFSKRLSLWDKVFGTYKDTR